MSWTAPLVNRNKTDLAQANKRAQWNAEDMNRVNGNILFLAGLAGLTLEAKTDYVPGDFLYEGDMDSILRSIEALLEYWREHYPETNPQWYELGVSGSIALQYETLNQVERMLLRMYRSWQGYVGPLLYTGEIKAGDEAGVYYGV